MTFLESKLALNPNNIMGALGSAHSLLGRPENLKAAQAYAAKYSTSQDFSNALGNEAHNL